MTHAIKDLNEIPDTMQALFDLVFTRLNQQEWLGYNFDAQQCDYRGSGNCCAIGLLIPDETANLMYEHMDMNRTIDTLLNFLDGGIDDPFFPNSPVHEWASRMRNFSSEFLRDLQSIHDDASSAKRAWREEQFREGLQATAAKWGLDDSKIQDMDWEWIENYDVPED